MKRKEFFYHWFLALLAGGAGFAIAYLTLEKDWWAVCFIGGVFIYTASKTPNADDTHS